jgi:hypothetical protein
MFLKMQLKSAENYITYMFQSDIQSVRVAQWLRVEKWGMRFSVTGAGDKSKHLLDYFTLIFQQSMI